MRQRTKALWVWGVVSLLSLLLLVTKGTREFSDGALLLIWLFFSWNFYAFGFSNDMWPFQFAELKKNGSKIQREVFFWGTSVVYLSLLAVIAWAE
jgi:hypothetical protein